MGGPEIAAGRTPLTRRPGAEKGKPRGSFGRNRRPLGVFLVGPAFRPDQPSLPSAEASGRDRPSGPTADPRACTRIPLSGLHPVLANKVPFRTDRILSDRSRPPSRVGAPLIWFPSSATSALYALRQSRVKPKRWLVFAHHRFNSRRRIRPTMPSPPAPTMVPRAAPTTPQHRVHKEWLRTFLVQL